MRKLLPGIILIIAFMMNETSYAQIPNPGFENWTMTPYWNPTGYFTGNAKTIARQGVAPVTRVAGAGGDVPH